MQTRIKYLLPALLLLASCSGYLLKPASDDAASLLPPGVRIESGGIDSSTGCRLDYRIYTRALREGEDGDNQTSDLVVLAHGFLRSQARMQTLAAAIAAAGTPVATLNFCNSSPWDGRHAQNGLDNGRAVVAATDWGRVQPIDGAGHCDFEAPTDQLCERICTDPDAATVSASKADVAATRPADGTGRQEIAVESSVREHIIASTQLAVGALFDGDLLAWPRPPQGL